ncbi:EAL domain-containing protein [Oxalobacteraceae bacterium OM1]|nr:EAL domain-containing protein [Oxalobacteraceae bacterium OM1]
MRIDELHFLVAEDSGFQRRLLVQILDEMGAARVTEAADGHEALRICRGAETPVHISVIDIDMPRMDGIELIRRLAEHNYDEAVIVSSALDPAVLAAVETMSRAYGIHLLGVVEKPATPDKLMPLIRAYKPPSQRAKAAAPANQPRLEDILEGLKNNEFEPYFQPKVELASGRVWGAEALARWHRPHHGLVPPAAFVPLLEQHGMLDRLAWPIIEKSVTACVRWQQEHLPLRVAINLSFSTLADPGFAESVAAFAALKGVDPDRIIFEVTESVAMTDVPHCLENLARLRMKGFHLSVDDFGTGHSSLKQLLRIPFGELKLDRSFVSGAARHAARNSVLRSSLELAGRLHLHTVGEGVETQEDWDLLHKLGCESAQGFLIGRPMAAGPFHQWLVERMTPDCDIVWRR